VEDWTDFVLNFICERKLPSSQGRRLSIEDPSIALIPNAPCCYHEHLHEERQLQHTPLALYHLKNTSLHIPNEANAEPAGNCS
jgi:hypothetical protein